MKTPDLAVLLEAKEGENIEFKEAKNSFEFEDLVKYACAIANEGGGYVVFGVSDKRPRRVVGSQAFDQPERTRAGLMDRLHLRLDFHLLEKDGKREALGRLLGQAEVIFEYRSTEASGPAQQREEFRQGFFAFYDRLWELINLRNDKQHYQDGLFVLDVPTFDERVVREAILNAVSHRDYQMGGSVFVRQYPQKLVIDSPGGLPSDVTLETILDRQSPRNRRIADIFARCGLVERSGQGMNLMFELSIKQAKHVPNFRGTDRYHVILNLDGLVQDPRFLQLMERIGQETLAGFNTQDFLLVNTVHREQPMPESLRERLPHLLELGIVERAGKGRFMLGRRFYAATGKKGVYTRKRGLDRDTNKTLLLKHIRENAVEGSRLEELIQVLPSLSKYQVQSMVRELKRLDLVCLRGATRGGKWFPAKMEHEDRGDCV